MKLPELPEPLCPLAVNENTGEWPAARMSGEPVFGAEQMKAYAAAAVETLRAERDAFKADAERYRYLRDTPWSTSVYHVVVWHASAKWDAEIDAARAALEPKREA